MFFKVLTVLTTSDINEYFINHRFFNPKPLLDKVKYTMTDLSGLSLEILFFLEDLEIFLTSFVFFYDRPATMLMFFFLILKILVRLVFYRF